MVVTKKSETKHWTNRLEDPREGFLRFNHMGVKLGGKKKSRKEILFFLFFLLFISLLVFQTLIHFLFC